MPSGKIHSANSLSIAGLIAGSAYFLDPLFISNGDVVAMVLGSISGVMLSPDLDVNKAYIGVGLLKKIPFIGFALGWAWKLFWLPYALLIPHRHWLSHAPIISTIGRVAILFLTFVILGVSSAIDTRLFFMWFIGLVISDTFHFFADLIDGEMRENGIGGY